MVDKKMRNTVVNTSGDTVMILGSGALDFTNCEEFHDALVKWCATAEKVVVDLRTAEFIDTAVLEYLARAGNAMRRRGKNLEVICLPDSHPVMVLHVSNIDTLMDVKTEPSPEPEALNDWHELGQLPELSTE